jgi:hypothetical protein
MKALRRAPHGDWQVAENASSASVSTEFLQSFKSLSVRHFDRLSAGSELRRRIPREFFHDPAN